jgi:protein SCO1/2
MDMRRRQFLVSGAVIVGGVLLGTTMADLIGPAEGESFDGSPDGRFPNIVLHGHDGGAYRFYDDLIRDKIVLINMFFTGCGDICPLSTQHLVQAQEMLGDRVGRDIFMYSITLNPELDTEPVIRDYAETYGVGPGWLFLRASRDDTELLRRALGFVDPDPALDADLETHIGIVEFGNDAIGRWGACPSFADAEEIVAGVRTLDPIKRV